MDKKVIEFQQIVWAYYTQHGRDLPWRHTHNPYKILVSELMLQQTQVSRVIPKYAEFLDTFPDIEALAQASLAQVLKIWSGLGYNRRAKYLHEAAKQVVRDYHTKLPQKLDELVKLPGVGKNTAGAILAYVYNQPIVFIETNIRSVFIHHFFADKTNVSDAELLPLIEQSLDTENPREWYWALMDYGSHLKATSGNAAQRSKHHTKQSRFEGSARQVRGKILRTLGERPHKLADLLVSLNDKRAEQILGQLTQEGLVHINRGRVYLGAPET